MDTGQSPAAGRSQPSVTKVVLAGHRRHAAWTLAWRDGPGLRRSGPLDRPQVIQPQAEALRTAHFEAVDDSDRLGVGAVRNVGDYPDGVHLTVADHLRR
jgi:hypothetical protein